MLGNVMTATSCPTCSGTGQEIVDRCSNCRGAGRVETTDTLTVTIPPGVEDGSRLRVTGRGAAGLRGGRAGDLYVGIAVAPHGLFRRAGADLGCEVAVPMTVAALGGELEIPTLIDGTEVVEVKPGTQAGEVVRLKGKGMPRLGGCGRGELVVLLKVETPSRLDERQEELLRQLAEERGEVVAERGLLGRIKEAFR
jgi:molecular chaperone DnaJ